MKQPAAVNGLLRTLKQHAGIYSLFVKNCFAEAMSYRLHFVLLVVMDILFYLSVIGTVEFLFLHLDQIGSWNRTDFLFFMAFMLAVQHLHMTFVSENFWRFAEDVRMGQLDFILLKPANSLFVSFFRTIRPGTLLNGFFPWGYLIYFGLQLQLAWWQWLILPVLVLFGLTLMVAVEILMSLSMFYTVESMGVNFLRMQLQQVSRWPDLVYQTAARRLFTFLIPVLLIGSAPVHFLKDPSQWQGLVKMLVAIIVCSLLIAWGWRRGLRAYESASS